jgi:cell division protein FtsB
MQPHLIAAACIVVGSAILIFTAGRLVQYLTQEKPMSAKLDTLAATVAALTSDVQTLIGLSTTHATNSAAAATEIASDEAQADQLNATATALHDQVTAAITQLQTPAAAPAA